MIIIRDGNVRSADYLFFEVNGTPGHANARIDNITLWTNISGTWQANFTNGTIGAINTIVNRIFNSTDTNIIESILTDNLVFIWGAQVCDNKTVYTEESVNLDDNAFGTIFDNNTGCTGACNFTVIVTAGRGFLANTPMTAITGVENSTTSNDISHECRLNNSETGLFYCNQTRTIWNGTAQIIDTLIESNVLVNYTRENPCAFTVNRTVNVQQAPNITITSPTDGQ
ncbi:hypothetical protein LCGC14_2634460, partial [marine sediment metagenome]